jgi:hypothetical protein
MLSAFCGRGEDRTQYLSACSPTLYPLSYPARHGGDGFDHFCGILHLLVLENGDIGVVEHMPVATRGEI